MMTRLRLIRTYFPLILVLATCSLSPGQTFKKPSEGKTMVYFVRYQGAVALVDFKYFDGEKYLGRISGKNYVVYECDPGEHVFWVAAENREFITGDLKANSTYVIEVRPYMRAISAGVTLYQVSPDNDKVLNQIRQLINKLDPAALKGQQEDQASFMEAGMKEYEKNIRKTKKINSEWAF